MIDVTVVLLDGAFMSTAVGPLEVFHSAGTLWNVLVGQPQTPRFRVRTASLRNAPVNSPHGVRLSAETTIDQVRSTDLIIVAATGLNLDQQLEANSDLFPWLRRHAAKGAYVAGICSGAAYLAAAGLLDGREATTHWACVAELQRRFPAVQWRPEKFVTEDRRVLCSGGVYASIDLSMYLVEKLCGHEIAVQTAKALLINMPRAQQTGYALLPLARPHDDDVIRSAEVRIQRDYAQPLDIEALARQAHMSPRNFIRRFKTATGRTPGSYLQGTRIAVAKQMLESGARSVQTVGVAIGYEDAAFFRAVFKRHAGMAPGEYRKNFGPVQMEGAQRQAARGLRSADRAVNRAG
jgi:transcriptional regulator GlxA family with amidase domain